jgi:hypothetical protein
MALSDDNSDQRSLPELLAHAISLRPALRDAGDPTARVAAAVAYDVALIRICERVNVPHGLASERAGPEARYQAEVHLLDHLPSLGGLLALDEQR